MVTVCTDMATRLSSSIQPMTASSMSGWMPLGSSLSSDRRVIFLTSKPWEEPSASLSGSAVRSESMSVFSFGAMEPQPASSASASSSVSRRMMRFFMADPPLLLRWAAAP